MQGEVHQLTTRVETLESQLADANARADAAEQRAQSAESAARAAQASATQLAAAIPPMGSTGAAAEPDIKVSWKGAPEIEGKGGWTFKPRGRIQYDAGFVSAPSGTGRPDGFGNEARRARLGVEGDMPGGFGYKFEFDFAPGEDTLTDAFLSYKDGPVTVTVGQQNNFQSLEELSSSRFISMLDRAAFTDAFNFERRVGASVQYGKGPVLVQGGLFTDNINSLSNKNWSADGRVVFMPKAGDTLFHLGASVHYAGLQDGSTVRYRQRPLVHFTSERFINTGTLDADSEFGLGLEAAAIAGRFHTAGEAYWQHVSRPGALSDPTFFGGYAEVGVFLTDDTRGYKKGQFDRVKPKHPVGEGGMGAVQLNLRYDYLDLNDKGIVGGTQNGLMGSIIWTPTDYTRFMVNYAHLIYDNATYALPNGDRSYAVDAFGVRAQVDF
ncbi:MAG: hypothetical protein IE933_01990 [Sphingomonadales bacterium]|nr:hypothetical protein [Sphingomonadales bacterium]MBD3773399.1 hypothetical protein [Paracoccaceae bacterium]